MNVKRTSILSLQGVQHLPVSALLHTALQGAAPTHCCGSLELTALRGSGLPYSRAWSPSARFLCNHEHLALFVRAVGTPAGLHAEPCQIAFAKHPAPPWGRKGHRASPGVTLICSSAELASSQEMPRPSCRGLLDRKISYSCLIANSIAHAPGETIFQHYDKPGLVAPSADLKSLSWGMCKLTCTTIIQLESWVLQGA